MAQTIFCNKIKIFFFSLRFKLKKMKTIINKGYNCYCSDLADK